MKEVVKIKILGSASGIPTKSRFNSSIALIINRNKQFREIYLFDCGEPISASLIKSGIHWNEIKAIFVSHFHCDHVSGVPQLIQSMQLTNRKNPLVLFLPQEGIEIMREYLELLKLEQSLLPFQLKISPLCKGFVFHERNIMVSAFSTTHLPESYGFLIEVDRKRILYSGDIGALDDIRDICGNVSLLILELAHIKPEDASSFVVASKKVEKAILTHLHPDLDDREEEILSLFPPSFRERVFIAYDGLEINV